MASRTKSLATHEIGFLKETLHAQQELLQKLYTELDAERESSATAADEALSMILRLQGEKAAMGMEASQYKRIAEEKMHHAEETLEIFQELIYQKEMQIASLEFQYPENILSRKNGVTGESSSRSSIKRGSSMPPPPGNGAISRRASTEGTKSSASSPKTMQETKGVVSSIQKEQGDFVSYWEEIMKLDERVKELDNLKDCNSFYTVDDTKEVLVTSTSLIQDNSPKDSSAKSDFSESPENVVSVEACGDSACSTSVQDIFEVPICSYNNQGGSSSKKKNSNLTLENVNRNGKLDLVLDEVWKSDTKEKFDWEKKPLLSPNSKKWVSKTSDAKERIDWEEKPLLSPGSSSESPKPKYGKTDRPLLFKHPTYGVADFELQQFNRRLKQLEDQRFVSRAHETNGESAEESRVLWEIRDKIESMQAEITSWKTKKPSPPVDSSPGCFKEVCFSVF
ncbi:Myosin-binding protein 7 [Bienertia sinuspersici]